MSVNWTAWGLLPGVLNLLPNLMRLFTCGLIHWLRVFWSGLHHWLTVDWSLSRSCRLDCSSDPCILFGACIVSGVGGRVKKRLEYLTSRCNVPRNRRLMHSQVSNAVIRTNHQTSIAGNTNLPFSEDSSPPVLTPHSPWAKEKQVFVLTEPKPIISQHSWATVI